MSLTPRQQALIADLMHTDDLHERLALVVDRARRSPKLPPQARTAENRVPGCTSSVWLVATLQDDRCQFRVGADSPVVLGLVMLVADFHTGATPSEILAAHADPLALLDLTRTLSPTRRHGLAAVRAAIHAFAEQSL